jgi:hypothetical protein
MSSGQFTIGGRPVTTEGVKEILAATPASA